MNRTGWLLVVVLLARPIAAEEPVERARALYLDGKQQFESQHYQIALHLFERAYEVSSRPALLFDMATCLQALDRPREAAAKLRDYLSRVPQERQRGAIEDSIGELKARAVEQEAAARAEREGTVRDEPQRAALEERIRLLEERLGTTAPSRTRRNLAIGLGVTAGVLVIATAITLGVVLNRPESYTPSSFGGGPLQSTR